MARSYPMLPLLVLMLAIIVGPSPALALDCHGLIPLPDDLHVTQAGADVPAAFARFGGAWVGAWRNADGDDIQCTALVVEELHTNGFARVVYSVAASSKTGNGLAYLFRVGARYVDGELKFVLPTPA